MVDGGSSSLVRGAGYLVLAALAVAARWRERRHAGSDDGVWPPFWWLTALFLLLLALGRAGGAGSLLSDFGRWLSVEEGWYGSRRSVQAAAVVVLGGVWLIVIVASGRSPARRRRYLPVGVMLATLAVFAAIRVVSLHQVDSVLHRRAVAGVRVGTLLELALQLATAVSIVWVSGVRVPAAHDRATEDPQRTSR